MTVILRSGTTCGQFVAKSFRRVKEHALKVFCLNFARRQIYFQFSVEGSIE